MNLRPYQTAAIQRARAAVTSITDGRRSVLLVAPTGSGKTVIGAEIVRSTVERGGRALWLAPRTELVDQSAAALKRLELVVGVQAAGSMLPPNPYAPVQVASIQTLLARGDRPRADVVVFDEAHHAASDTYSALVDAYASATVVGLTATPERSDGRGLGHMFRRLVVVATPRELTEAGHLVPCEVVAPAARLKPGQIAQRPVDAHREHAGIRSTLVFSPNLAMAAQHLDEFRRAQVDAIMVEGKADPGERAAVLRSFLVGNLPVLINVGILTEGTDLPIASCVILARGCGTPGLYLQMVGRALRPHPGKASALLIDLQGVSHVHGHPADDRTYSLEGRGIQRDGDAGSDQSYCRVCGAPIATGTPCEECGTAARVAKPLTVTGERLQKYAHLARFTDEQRAKMLATLLRKSKSEKQALVIYARMHGGWPPGAVQAAARAML